MEEPEDKDWTCPLCGDGDKNDVKEIKQTRGAETCNRFSKLRKLDIPTFKVYVLQN